jgi:hypothetical protein
MRRRNGSVRAKALRPDQFGDMRHDALIQVYKNPLDPLDRKSFVVPAGTILIAWMQRIFPLGFGRPVTITLDGLDLPIDDTDVALKAGEVVTIHVTPGGPAFGAALVAALISSLVTVAATLITTMIFGKPKTPGTTPAADPVYSISGAQNAARIGDPIPVAYGQVIQVPDYASQPYQFFTGNQQYTDQILCIGKGWFDVLDVLLADTPASALTGDAVTYWVFAPDQHGGVMGTIEGATGVMENVVSSPEVSTQELPGTPGTGNPGFGGTITGYGSVFAPNEILFTSATAPDTLPGNQFHLTTNTRQGDYTVSRYDGPDAPGLYTVEQTLVNEYPTNLTLVFKAGDPTRIAGPFICAKPGARGNRLMLDFVFAGGLFTLDSNSQLTPATVDIQIIATPIDDTGATAGADIVHVETVTRSSNTPQRLTVTLDVPTGRYKVQVKRLTAGAPNTQTVNSFTWTALKFRLINATQAVYAGCTLLVIRIRATNGIASDASSRISAKVVRKLADLGRGARRATRDPADAFYDVYTDTAYGAGRPGFEVDTNTLLRLRANWAGDVAFDGIFNQKQTIWDGLTMTAQVAVCSPLPLGQAMSMVQDGVKAFPSYLFTDANMISSSLSLTYTFDKPGDYDGVEVEYRDPATFNALTVVWPATAVDADKLTLFGCTDVDVAAGYARLMWNRRLMQRKGCLFATELEGLLPLMGDRIAVAAQMPRWGMSGLVYQVDGGGIGGLPLVVTLDQAPDWTQGPLKVMFRSETGGASPILDIAPGQGATDIVVAGDPGFALFAGPGQEPTHYSVGLADTVVKAFTVTDMQHQGGVATQITGTIYDEAIYAGTLPWLERAM